MVDSATWKLLDVLLEVGPEGATREHLVQRAGASQASFYRKVKPLVDEGLVKEREGVYSLPLSSLHNYRCKLWRDSRRLYRLPPMIRDYVLDLRAQSLRDLGTTCSRSGWSARRPTTRWDPEAISTFWPWFGKSPSSITLAGNWRSTS